MAFCYHNCSDLLWLKFAILGEVYPKQWVRTQFLGDRLSHQSSFSFLLSVLIILNFLIWKWIYEIFFWIAKAEEGSTEDKILDFAGDLLGKLAGAGAKMGDADVNKLCGKVKQTQTVGENTNGGNTVQISTLGIFFLALAIFNH